MIYPCFQMLVQLNSLVFRRRGLFALLIMNSILQPSLHAMLDEKLEPASSQPAENYFPPPESQGGWRKLERPADIRSLAGADPAKLDRSEEHTSELQSRLH